MTIAVQLEAEALDSPSVALTAKRQQTNCEVAQRGQKQRHQYEAHIDTTEDREAAERGKPENDERIRER